MTEIAIHRLAIRYHTSPEAIREWPASDTQFALDYSDLIQGTTYGTTTTQ